MAEHGLPKPLADLSDRELEEEVQRRRRLRAAAKRPEAPITETERRALDRFERGEARGSGGDSDMAAAVERADYVKHYSALELRPGATLAQVEKAYRELVAKYDPAKHARDPEKHRAATQLVAELTRAREVLADRLATNKR